MLLLCGLCLVAGQTQHVSYLFKAKGDTIVDIISDTLLVQAPSGAATGFRVETGGSGAAQNLNWNRMDISSDNVDSGNTKVDGLQVYHSFGGSSVTGIRNAIEGVATLTQATSSQNQLLFYTGGTFTADIQSADGGTSTNARGSGYGINPVGILRASATNINNITAAEFNVTAVSGSSVRYKSVIQLTTGGGGPSQPDSAQGSAYDCSIAISSQNGPGVHNGILFGPMNGQQPVSQNGTLIASSGLGTIYRGIDFSSYNITDAIISAQYVSLTQNGLTLSQLNSAIELGNIQQANTPYIDFHSSGYSVDYDARIIVRGGNTNVGQGSFQFLSAQIGFFGATPVAQPTITGSRGGNSAVQSLITALARIGLLIDNTTA